MKLSDRIRSAVKQQQGTVSIYRLAMDCRIEEKSLRAFMHKGKGLSLAAVDRLVEHLGLERLLSSTHQTPHNPPGLEGVEFPFASVDDE